MLKMLDILEDYLHYKGYEFVRLDGSVDVKTRNQDIDKFNNDKDCFVFLLSTKAGGYGINLKAATNAIIYDR